MNKLLDGFRVTAEGSRSVHAPRAVTTMLKTCIKLPDNELLTTREMVGRCKLSKSYAGQHINAVDLEPFRCMIQHRYLWGNQKTIEKLRARIKNAH